LNEPQFHLLFRLAFQSGKRAENAIPILKCPEKEMLSGGTQFFEMVDINFVEIDYCSVYTSKTVLLQLVVLV
jgi:intergrase/recombinase